MKSLQTDACRRATGWVLLMCAYSVQLLVALSSAKTQMAHTRPRAPASDAIAPIRGRARALECYLFPLEYNRAIGPQADYNRCARMGLSRAIASLVFECTLAKGRSRRDACRSMGRAGHWTGLSQGFRGTQMHTREKFMIMNILATEVCV